MYALRLRHDATPSLGALPQHLPHAVGDPERGAPPALAAEGHVVPQRLLQPRRGCCGARALLLRRRAPGRLVAHRLRAEPAEPTPAEGGAHAQDVVPGAVLYQPAALAPGALYCRLHGRRGDVQLELEETLIRGGAVVSVWETGCCI